MKQTIMVNGLGNPGKMAGIIANGILGEYPDTYKLFGSALTGPNQEDSIILDDSTEIELIKPEDHAGFLSDVVKAGPIFAIDFCKGEGVADRNARMYFENNIPFVMGSTGVDSYKELAKIASATNTPCVAGPNMDPRIVAWIEGIAYIAEKYARAFEGANTELLETHQADKVNADGDPETSGTMKRMLKDVGRLVGKELTTADIKSIRDPDIQARLLKVPDNWIKWHAYHFFEIYNEHDGVRDSEELIFRRHGGDGYRRGTMMALDLLVNKRYKKPFNEMIDVIEVN